MILPDPVDCEKLMAYIFVPSTIGEISDHIGAMVLCMPDMNIPNTDLGLDGAYAQLEHSLGLVKAKLGEERYTQLIDMARRSKEHFVDGQNKDGRFMLQDMKKLLNKRG